MVKYPDLSKLPSGSVDLKANPTCESEYKRCVGHEGREGHEDGGRLQPLRRVNAMSKSIPAGGSFYYPARYRVIFETGEPRYKHVDSIKEGKDLLQKRGGLILDNQSRQVLFETEKRMNPSNVEIDVVLNEVDAIPPGRWGYPPKLWLFQFGTVGTTNVAVWDGGHLHLEGALEEAAGWLAENAPGHITSEEEMAELYKEAADDLGVPWPPKGRIDWDDKNTQKVTEQAEADMTYTESGWLTSYEWYVNELEPGSELYNEVFEQTVDELDLDEDEIETANEIAKKIGLDAEWQLDDED